MTNPLLQAFEELKNEEQAKKKRKTIFNVKKEKRLQYYSGWGKGDKAMDKEKIEKQKRLC